MERARVRPSLVPKLILIDTACNFEDFQRKYIFIRCIFIYSQCIFKYFPLMEIPLICGLCHYLWCRRGNNHFYVPFRLIRPVHFLSKDGKDAVREGRKGWKSVYFPPESASFPL